MPNMASITVKKADAVTDVTYNALTPSAGDQTPARWVEAGSLATAYRASMECRSRYNNARTARHVETVYRRPETVEVDSQRKLVATGHINLSGVIPTNMSPAEVDEMVAQAFNLFKSALISEVYETGYAPQ